MPSWEDPMKRALSWCFTAVVVASGLAACGSDDSHSKISSTSSTGDPGPHCDDLTQDATCDACLQERCCETTAACIANDTCTTCFRTHNYTPCAGQDEADDLVVCIAEKSCV